MNAAEKIKYWRENPIQFVIENFNAIPDKWQEQALYAFISGDRDKLRISLQACAGPGKSAVLAWCGWLFLSCFGEIGHHPKGAAVSITKDNLKDNLWTELSKWQQRSEFLMAAFQWTKEKIFAKDHPSTWFLVARSFPKSANKEEIGKTLSGVHGKYVLFLIDESGAIPPEIGKAAEQAVGEALNNEGSFIKIIQAGNPLTTDGLLFEASRNGKWYVIRINGDPDNPDRSPRINKEWAQEQIDLYGRDDPWVMSYILGRFPKTAINTLLTIDEVQDAMERHHHPNDYNGSQKKLGIDVARFGADSTVIFPRQGLAAFKYKTMRKANSNQITARVIAAKLKWGSDLEFVDGTGGFGSGVIDNMMQAGYNPFEIHFSSNPNDSKYYNKRSEMWFELAKWVKRGGALPKCPELKKELSAPTYTFHNGKFRIESKDQIKKRLGYSPDRADALALTFAMPDMPREDELTRSLQKRNKVKTEFNPMETI